jgi:carbamate kinase
MEKQSGKNPLGAVLIAIGGNAIYDKQSGDNLSPAHMEIVCQHVAAVCEAGYQPVITFGNGPQVGNLLDMAETSARMFSTPVTLDTCVAWTQGEIGYRLGRELNRQLIGKGIHTPVIAVNTLVEVDPADVAFQNPSKPVGRFISAQEAQQLYEERGWVVGPDANRGYRRRVPSPRPIATPEADAIQALLNQGCIVLCGGGGGIPVKRNAQGALEGVEAVIDKDFTSCMLAKVLKIPTLVICTEVEQVCLNFGTPEEKPLRQLSLTEATRYFDEGHFAAGSMGPKVAALIDYVQQGGKRAIITSLDKLGPALAGQAGTEIVSTAPMPVIQ